MGADEYNTRRLRVASVEPGLAGLWFVLVVKSGVAIITPATMIHGHLDNDPQNSLDPNNNNIISIHSSNKRRGPVLSISLCLATIKGMRTRGVPQAWGAVPLHLHSNLDPRSSV